MIGAVDAQLRHGPRPVLAGGLGRAGHRDQRGSDLRLVLQGDQPHDLAPWFALGVLALGFVSTFVTRARRSPSTRLADLAKSRA
jgi:hypothetical protein